MRTDVAKMLKNEGLYLAADPRHPEAIVPIVSKNRKLFSMKVDAVLSPERFFENTTIHGPVVPSEANRVWPDAENIPNGVAWNVHA